MTKKLFVFAKILIDTLIIYLVSFVLVFSPINNSVVYAETASSAPSGINVESLLNGVVGSDSSSSSSLIGSDSATASSSLAASVDSSPATPKEQECVDNSEGSESKRDECLSSLCDSYSDQNKKNMCTVRRCNYFGDAESQKSCRDSYAMTEIESKLKSEMEAESTIGKISMLIGLGSFILNSLWTILSGALGAQDNCSAASGIVMSVSGLISGIGEIVIFIYELLETKKLLDKYKRGHFIFNILSASAETETASSQGDSSKQIEAFDYLIEQNNLNLKIMTARVAIQYLSTALSWVAVGLSITETYAMANPASAAANICPGKPQLAAALSQISPSALNGKKIVAFTNKKGNTEHFEVQERGGKIVSYSKAKGQDLAADDFTTVSYNAKGKQGVVQGEDGTQIQYKNGKVVTTPEPKPSALADDGVEVTSSGTAKTQNMNISDVDENQIQGVVNKTPSEIEDGETFTFNNKTYKATSKGNNNEKIFVSTDEAKSGKTYTFQEVGEKSGGQKVYQRVSFDGNNNRKTSTIGSNNYVATGTDEKGKFFYVDPAKQGERQYLSKGDYLKFEGRYVDSDGNPAVLNSVTGKPALSQGNKVVTVNGKSGDLSIKTVEKVDQNQVVTTRDHIDSGKILTERTNTITGNKTATEYKTITLQGKTYQKSSSDGRFYPVGEGDNGSKGFQINAYNKGNDKYIVQTTDGDNGGHTVLTYKNGTQSEKAVVGKSINPVSGESSRYVRNYVYKDGRWVRTNAPEKVKFGEHNYKLVENDKNGEGVYRRDASINGEKENSKLYSFSEDDNGNVTQRVSTNKDSETTHISTLSKDGKGMTVQVKEKDGSTSAEITKAKFTQRKGDEKFESTSRVLASKKAQDEAAATTRQQQQPKGLINRAKSFFGFGKKQAEGKITAKNDNTYEINGEKLRRGSDGKLYNLDSFDSNGNLIAGKLPVSGEIVKINGEFAIKQSSGVYIDGDGNQITLKPGDRITNLTTKTYGEGSRVDLVKPGSTRIASTKIIGSEGTFNKSRAVQDSDGGTTIYKTTENKRVVVSSNAFPRVTKVGTGAYKNGEIVKGSDGNYYKAQDFDVDGSLSPSAKYSGKSVVITETGGEAKEALKFGNKYYGVKKEADGSTKVDFKSEIVVTKKGTVISQQGDKIFKDNSARIQSTTKNLGSGQVKKISVVTTSEESPDVTITKTIKGSSEEQGSAQPETHSYKKIIEYGKNKYRFDHADEEGTPIYVRDQTTGSQDKGKNYTFEFDKQGNATSRLSENKSTGTVTRSEFISDNTKKVTLGKVSGYVTKKDGAWGNAEMTEFNNKKYVNVETKNGEKIYKSLDPSKADKTYTFSKHHEQQDGTVINIRTSIKPGQENNVTQGTGKYSTLGHDEKGAFYVDPSKPKGESRQYLSEGDYLKLDGKFYDSKGNPVAVKENSNPALNPGKRIVTFEGKRGDLSIKTFEKGDEAQIITSRKVIDKGVVTNESSKVHLIEEPAPALPPRLATQGSSNPKSSIPPVPKQFAGNQAGSNRDPAPDLPSRDIPQPAIKLASSIAKSDNPPPLPDRAAAQAKVDPKATTGANGTSGSKVGTDTSQLKMPSKADLELAEKNLSKYAPEKPKPTPPKSSATPTANGWKNAVLGKKDDSAGSKIQIGGTRGSQSSPAADGNTKLGQSAQSIPDETTPPTKPTSVDPKATSSTATVASKAQNTQSKMTVEEIRMLDPNKPKGDKPSFISLRREGDTFYDGENKVVSPRNQTVIMTDPKNSALRTKLVYDGSGKITRQYQEENVPGRSLFIQRELNADGTVKGGTKVGVISVAGEFNEYHQVKIVDKNETYQGPGGIEGSKIEYQGKKIIVPTRSLAAVEVDGRTQMYYSERDDASDQSSFGYNRVVKQDPIDKSTSYKYLKGTKIEYSSKPDPKVSKYETGKIVPNPDIEYYETSAKVKITSPFGSTEEKTVSFNMRKGLTLGPVGKESDVKHNLFRSEKGVTYYYDSEDAMINGTPSHLKFEGTTIYKVIEVKSNTTSSASFLKTLSNIFIPSVYAMINTSYLMMGAQALIMAGGMLNPQGIIADILRAAGVILSVVMVVMCIIGIVSQVKGITSGGGRVVEQGIKWPVTRVLLGIFNAAVATILAVLTTIQMTIMKKRITAIKNMKKSFEDSQTLDSSDLSFLKKLENINRFEINDVDRKTITLIHEKMEKVKININRNMGPEEIFAVAIENDQKLEKLSTALEEMVGIAPAKAAGGAGPYWITKKSDVRICVNEKRQIDMLCDCATNDSCFKLSANNVPPGMAGNKKLHKLFGMTNGLMGGQMPYNAIDPLEMKGIAMEMKKSAEIIRNKYNHDIKSKKMDKLHPVPTFETIAKKTLHDYKNKIITKDTLKQYKDFQSAFSAGGIMTLARTIHDEEVKKNPNLAKEIEASYKMAPTKSDFEMTFLVKHPTVAKELEKLHDEDLKKLDAANLDEEGDISGFQNERFDKGNNAEISDFVIGSPDINKEVTADLFNLIDRAYQRKIVDESFIHY